MTKEEIEHAEQIARRLQQYDTVYLRDFSLPKQVRVFAAALYCVALRETYPGGKSEFDRLASEAAKHYDAVHRRTQK